MVTKKVTCPMCHGEGGWTQYHGEPWLYEDFPCLLCDGKCEVTQKKRMEYVRSFKNVN